MSKRRFLGLIPARGGSKGISNKNIVDVNGKPLIAYSIEAARKADSIDEVVVSTDSEEIRSVASQHGASAPYLRPRDLARDETPTEPVIEHAVSYEALGEYDSVVLLQPTSPLRTLFDIEHAIELYLRKDATSLVSVSKDHSYRWKRTSAGAVRKNYQEGRLRRQEKSPEYVENGAIYIVKIDEFLETGDLQAGTTVLYTMPEERSVDIDTEFDRFLAEQLLRYDGDFK